MHRDSKYLIREIILLSMLVMFVFFLIPRLDTIDDSISTLAGADLAWVGFGLACMVATFITASLSYRSLSLYRLKVRRLFLVQVAVSFASKLVPAGVGGMTLNARFLMKNYHLTLEASSIATLNNLMGFFAHISLLVYVLIFGNSSFQEAFSKSTDTANLKIYLLAGGSITVLVFCAIAVLFRPKVVQFMHEFKRIVGIYRHNFHQLLGSFCSCVLITLSYCAILYASAQALGVSLTALQTIAAFSASIAAASVTPTPGGIGGAEAGLIAALIAAGVASPEAISITLMYRLISYWLPIVPGFIAFRYTLYKGYV